MNAPAILSAEPDARPKRIYLIVAFFVIFHLLALLAFVPYCFTWWGIPIVLVGNFIFGSIGINLAYHRILTHRSVVLPRWLEKFFILVGVCSLEGSPLRWVLTHRIHHQHSDEEGDPHSPRHRFYWGHMEWIYTEDDRLNSLDVYDRYVPDLWQDPFLRWLHRRYRWLWVQLLHIPLLVLLALGVSYAWTQDWPTTLQMTTQFFVWGVCVRTVYVWHITWFVNSASHRWGYRNYETSDLSYNNWWVALLTNGEGWHNNHHAAPRSLAHGHRWWEIDLTYRFVKLLALVGLAKEIVPISVAGYKAK